MQHRTKRQILQAEIDDIRAWIEEHVRLEGVEVKFGAIDTIPVVELSYDGATITTAWLTWRTNPELQALSVFSKLYVEWVRSKQRAREPQKD